MTPLPAGFQFREMTPADLPDVLGLIKRHHEDDYQAASASYQRSLNGQFVLLQDQRLAAVTGARGIPGTDRSFWLSWTYMDPSAAMELTNPGILFELIIDQLHRRADARKLFAMISPTVDSGLGGGHAYGGGLDSYLHFGFRQELTQRDYYAAGESLTIVSHRIDDEFRPENHPPETAAVQILDADEIAETDDAYYLDWDWTDSPAPPRHSIPFWIDQIRSWQGRVIFIGLPGHAGVAIEELKHFGFVDDGRLSDFYEDGLDEVRLRFDL